MLVTAQDPPKTWAPSEQAPLAVLWLLGSFQQVHSQKLLLTSRRARMDGWHHPWQAGEEQRGQREPQERRAWTVLTATEDA